MKTWILNIGKNIYVITGIVFVVWVTFFREIDLLYVIKESRKLKDIKEQVEELQKKNESTKELLQLYKTDKSVSEQFAREEYYMRKPNEEIYIFQEKKP